MPRLSLNETGLLPCENEEPYYMPAGPTDWHPFDSIFDGPYADRMPWVGDWRIGHYAIVKRKQSQAVALVRILWDPINEGSLVTIDGGESLPYHSDAVDPVYRAHMLDGGLLEAIALAAVGLDAFEWPPDKAED